MTAVSRDYPADAASCRRVRADLRDRLASWGVDAESAEDAVLVANELASNAVDHACTSFRVHVTLSERELRISVTDGSDEPLRQRPVDPGIFRGRGLQMIEALSDSWSVTLDESGKTVTAVLTVGDSDFDR